MSYYIASSDIKPHLDKRMNAGESMESLGRQCGINSTTIRSICLGRTKWVEETLADRIMIGLDLPEYSRFERITGAERFQKLKRV